jgi:DNA invertase Pin-like site-specific DNA recombinase
LEFARDGDVLVVARLDRLARFLTTDIRSLIDLFRNPPR